MRRLLLAAALIVAALPMTAQAQTCESGTIDWTSGFPIWQPVDALADHVASIQGTFLWVGSDETTVMSVELSGTEVGADVCADGTVGFTYGTPEVGTPELILDVTPEEWAHYIEADTFGIK